MLGASFATPEPSTPSSSHAFFARAGPRSGPPCFLDPPTIVGAILFEKTMNSKIGDKYTSEYLWEDKGIISC